MSSDTPANGTNHSEQQEWIKPITKENLGERAYLELRAALMRGQFRSGEKFLLRQMSEQFGISATPMREALLRLVGEKALTMDMRGTVITPTLSLEQLDEIRTLRIYLEGLGAAEAAKHATASEIEELEDIHRKISQCHTAEDYKAAIHLNTEFHLRLCQMAKMTTLYEIVEGLWVRCGPILSHLYDEGLPDWEPHPHLNVIAGLKQRDPELATSAIRLDIEHGGQGLYKHVKSVMSGTNL